MRLRQRAIAGFGKPQPHQAEELSLFRLKRNIDFFQIGKQAWPADVVNAGSIFSLQYAGSPGILAEIDDPTEGIEEAGIGKIRLLFNEAGQELTDFRFTLLPQDQGVLESKLVNNSVLLDDRLFDNQVRLLSSLSSPDQVEEYNKAGNER